MREAQKVAVTAAPRKVEHRKLLGQVEYAEGRENFQDEIVQLQKRTATIHGNALLVSSYSGSNSGSDYLCDPPIKPDSDG